MEIKANDRDQEHRCLLLTACSRGAVVGALKKVEGKGRSIASGHCGALIF